MAVLMMANDESKPMFHDFFGVSRSKSAVVSVKAGVGEARLSEASPSASVGMSSTSQALLSASSNLGSERQAGNDFDGDRCHGPKSDSSGAEMSNIFSGGKRSSSTAAFMCSTQDQMLQINRESSRMKMFQNVAASEQPKRSHEDELFFGVQAPRPTSSSPFTLQSTVSARTDLIMSKWHQSIPMNSGPAVRYPSHIGQTSSVDKYASSRLRDASVSTSFIAQPASDEGSRTGIKGTSVLEVFNANAGTSERHQIARLTNSNRPNAGFQNTDVETSNLPRSTAACRQMTIFYAGQAHVFDDVHPSKADAIMALAGSNGGSWSTTYCPKTSVDPHSSEAFMARGEKDKSASNTMVRQKTSLFSTTDHIFKQGVGVVSSSIGEGRVVARADGPDTRGKKEV